MSTKLNRCDSCGHLSQSTTCHNCTNELGESETNLSIQDHDRYYNAISNGYAKIQFAGTLIAISGPFLSIFMVVLASYINYPQSYPLPSFLQPYSVWVEGIVLLLMLSGLSVIPFLGINVFLASNTILAGTDENFRSAFISSILASVTIMFISYILLAIPLINALYVIVLIVAAIVFFRATRQQMNIDRDTAVSKFIESDSSTPYGVMLALKLLLTPPTSEITARQRDIVIKQIEPNSKIMFNRNEISSRTELTHAEFIELLSSGFSDSKESKVRLVETVIKAGQEMESGGLLKPAKDCFSAANQFAGDYNIDHLEEEARRKQVQVQNQVIINSSLAPGTVASLPENDDPEQLIESLLDIGRESRSKAEYNKAIDCFETANQLASNSSLNTYQTLSEEKKAETKDQQMICSLLPDEIAAQLSGTYQSEELVELLLDIGKQQRSKKEYGYAEDCFEAAKKLNAQLDTGKYTSEVNSELDQNAALKSAARFRRGVDELRDIISTAEEAYVAGDQRLAIKRCLDIEARLQTFEDISEIEPKYQDFVDRFQSELIKSTRGLILSTVSDPPSSVEKRILATALPAPASKKFEEIYRGTLEYTAYRNILTESDIENIVQATTQINNYDQIKEQLRAVSDDPKPLIAQLDDGIMTGLPMNQLTLTHEEGIEKVRTVLDNSWIFAQSIKQICTLRNNTTNSLTNECLLVIKSALLNCNISKQGTGISQVEVLVDQIGAVNTYNDEFPSFSIATSLRKVIQQISSIEKVDSGIFTQASEQIEKAVRRETRRLSDELEKFIDEWHDHPTVEYRGWNRAVSKARRTDDPSPLIEPYQVMKQMQGTVWSYTDLHNFSWQEFEHLIASLYSEQGYETTVTSGSRDMGVDVWAETEIKSLAIQVKQFSQGNTVGREVIQKLESTLARGSADKIVIVTSSSFAGTASDYAAGSSQVELVDGEDLINQLTLHSIPKKV